MQCDFEIDVREPKHGDMMFRPFVTFRLVQLNPTAHCYNDSEIDWQVDRLVEEAENMRKMAKRKLREAITRHDALLEEKRQSQ